jgi:hypothetical protein
MLNMLASETTFADDVERHWSSRITCNGKSGGAISWEPTLPERQEILSNDLEGHLSTFRTSCNRFVLATIQSVLLCYLFVLP